MTDFPTLPSFLPDGVPLRDTRSPYPSHAERLRVGQPNMRDALSMLKVSPEIAERPPVTPAAVERPVAPAVERERLPSGRVFTDEPAYAFRTQARSDAPSAAASVPPARSAPQPAAPAAALPLARPEALGLRSLIDGILTTGLRVPPPAHRRVAGDLTEADTEDLFAVADPDEVAGAEAALRPRNAR